MRTLATILFLFAIVFAPLAAPVPAMAAHGDLDAGRRAYEVDDYDTVYRELGPLAVTGNAEAKFLVGDMLTRDGSADRETEGRNFVRDALKELTPRADAGDPDANYILALAHYWGNGVKKNRFLAIEYLYDAAKAGHERSQRALLGFYIDNSWGFGHGDLARFRLERLEKGINVGFYAGLTSLMVSLDSQWEVTNTTRLILAIDTFKWDPGLRLALAYRWITLESRQKILVDKLVELWRSGAPLIWARNLVGSPAKMLAYVADKNLSPRETSRHLYFNGWEKAALDVLLPLAQAGDRLAQYDVGFYHEIFHRSKYTHEFFYEYRKTLLGREDALVQMYRWYLAAARQGLWRAQRKLIHHLLDIEYESVEASEYGRRFYSYTLRKGNHITYYARATKTPKRQYSINDFVYEIWYRIAAGAGSIPAQERLRKRKLGGLELADRASAVKVADDVAKEWLKGDFKAWMKNILVGD